MTLVYEFGGNDDEQGEEFEYDVCRGEAFDVALRDIFDYENWKKVKEYLADYIDVDAFLDDSKDALLCAFEEEAYQAWKDSK